MFYAGEKIDSTEVKKKAKDMLDRVGLGDRLYNTPAQLSGGQQQRVAIARALINDPSLIFADEPTGNLDHENAIRVFDLITQQVKKRGATALIVTHNNELLKKGDRVITIKDGKIEFLH
jgi:ABC-type lipoprotein export system ATPase subunit